MKNPRDERTSEGMTQIQQQLELMYAFKGEKNPMAKLNWEIVHKIRAEYTGEKGQKARLSRKYGVHPTTLAKIVHNIFWTI